MAFLTPLSWMSKNRKNNVSHSKTPTAKIAFTNCQSLNSFLNFWCEWTQIIGTKFTFFTIVKWKVVVKRGFNKKLQKDTIDHINAKINFTEILILYHFEFAHLSHFEFGFSRWNYLNVKIFLFSRQFFFNFSDQNYKKNEDFRYFGQNHKFQLFFKSNL